MTSQKDQIQALITDIDSVLQKTTPRLPWVVSGEMTQQRQVLERVRNYLVTFQRRQIAGEGFEQAGARPDLLAHDIYYQPSPSPYQSSQGGMPPERSQAYSQSEVSAQQMLQTIVQEMGYLRSSLMQPLQTDVEGLRQQRESLVQEIRQLEAQRQGYAGQLPGQQPEQQQLIAEFLQALMSRLQETLPQQVAQTLRSSNQQSLPYAGDLAFTGSAPAIASTSNPSAQGFGNIQIPQSQTDELLIRLDSTLSVVFESLQRNVQAYEESLSQGLNKMHSLGQQGEMMFTALVGHLASQLGQEASSYLQPPASTRLEPARSTTNATASGMVQSAQPPNAIASPPFLESPKADATARPFTLPFPGTELSSSVADAMSASAPTVSEPSVDTAIESWLRAGSVEAAPEVDLEIAELNLEGFDLNQLAAQDVNALLELDANLLGTNLPPQPLLAPEPGAVPAPPIAAEPTSGAMSVEDTADIDAALKLLEQLSSELQEQPASVADADAQIDRIISSPTALPGEAATASIPDDARDELDEFYESLFGNQTTGVQSIVVEPPAAVPTAADEAPVLFEEIAHPPSASVVESELAIAPSGSQSINTPPPAPLAVDALPAEAQAPASALAVPEAAAPTVSVGIDPTLGWDLLAKPAVDQSAEPEIPAALLEDELLSGWDLEDADIGLAAPETPLAGDELFDDLLSMGESATPGDRDPSLVDMPSMPLTDAATAPVDPQNTLIDAKGEPADTAFVEPQTNLDEIATLTDLFGESAFADELPSEAPIVEPIASPQVLSQPPVEPSASAPNAVVSADETSRQTPPADQVDDRRVDDRYTPASPEEDLLPLQETVDESEPELWLDEGTLNRLSEDLFSLEDAIDDPSILPYGTDAGAAAPEPFSETTAAYETAPDSEPMSLEDWNAALDEPIEAPITDSTQTLFEPEQTTIAAEPPEAFILEGMDDLFANTPVVPPVTPALPPVSTQTEPSAAFTLEGMNDLFADPLTGTAPLPPAPLSSTPSLPPTPLAPTAPSASQPLPFTLEGMDDLFGDVPMVISTPLPAAQEQTQTPLFTLEGVGDLFADEPVNNVPAGSEAANTPSPSSEAEPSAFTLEQVGNLFVEVPSDGVAAPSSGVAVSSSPARTDVVETIAPSLQALTPEALSEPATAPTTPFTLEQVGDLFVEVPSGGAVLEAPAEDATALPSQVAESIPAPFTFDQMDALFAEDLSEIALPDPPLPQPPASTTEPSTLEQAFASLMGSFDEPALPSNETETDPQDPEKKKGMS